MKHIPISLLLILTLLATACGNDDPDPIKRPEVNISYTQLSHVGNGSATAAYSNPCKFTLRREALNADIEITLPAALGGETLRISTVPVTYNSDKNLYNINAATTSSPRVTNLSATIDFNEQAYWMNYTLDGDKTVQATMPGIFYLHTKSEMTCEDLSTYTDTRGGYQFDIYPAENKATLQLSDLLIKTDLVSITSMTAKGMNYTATESGYHITGDKIEGTGYISRYSQGSETSQMNDNMYYRLDNFAADLNLKSQDMTGTCTITRCKRVIDPETKVQTVQEINHTQVKLNGNTYKSFTPEPQQ